MVDRPPYDRFMLKIHHAMKEDARFQKTCRKDRWEFPAGSTWIVFTDSASHACLSGQFALEQTFIVRRASLECPEIAPIAILEKLAGHRLARERVMQGVNSGLPRRVNRDRTLVSGAIEPGEIAVRRCLGRPGG